MMGKSIGNIWKNAKRRSGDRLFVFFHILFRGYAVAAFKGAEKVGDVIKAAQLGNKIDFNGGVSAKKLL